MKRKIILNYMENLNTDEGRLNNFFELLPENAIDSFLNDELPRATCRTIYIATFDVYVYYRHKAFSDFQNVKVKKANEDFDDILRRLHAFLGDNFFSAGAHVLLYPDHKHSQEKMMRDFWIKQFKELESLRNEFAEKYKNFITVAINELSKNQENAGLMKNFPKSIHLVSQSIVANDTIFFVINEQWQMPIRFLAKNTSGDDSAIKKLHNIAYIVNAPGKSVAYERRLADNINNGIFRNAQISDYMTANKLDKPTLVRKSDKNTFVLKNETMVLTFTIQQVPPQFRPQYIDKTQ